jgi:hypothetical protein
VGISGWVRWLVELKLTTAETAAALAAIAAVDHIPNMKKLWEAMHSPGATGSTPHRLELMRSAKFVLLVMVSINLTPNLGLPNLPPCTPHWALFDLRPGQPGFGRAVDTSAGLWPLLGRMGHGNRMDGPRSGPLRPRLLGLEAHWSLMEMVSRPDWRVPGKAWVLLARWAARVPGVAVAKLGFELSHPHGALYKYSAARHARREPVGLRGGRESEHDPEGSQEQWIMALHALMLLINQLAGIAG